MKSTQGLNISFEFFPPKTTDGIDKLIHTASVLSAYAPEYFSVTFGAGGSTRDGTIETIKKLQESTTVNIAPHIACMGSKKQDLLDILEIYQASGIRQLVVLRGDLPSGMGNNGEFKFAYELVKLIRETSGDHFHIDVAAYPEFHPQAKSAVDDIINLKNKVDAGANSAITQYFFNADAYFYFLDECAKHDILIPITPGIMPITQFTKLVRFSDICGAEIPRWIRKRLESYGDDNDSIKSFGIEVIYDLCQRLLSGGAPGLHFYTLNHFDASSEIVQMLRKTYVFNETPSVLPVEI